VRRIDQEDKQPGELEEASAQSDGRQQCCLSPCLAPSEVSPLSFPLGP
jgi:hypothetical protein